MLTLKIGIAKTDILNDYMVCTKLHSQLNNKQALFKVLDNQTQAKNTRIKTLFATRRKIINQIYSTRINIMNQNFDES